MGQILKPAVWTIAEGLQLVRELQTKTLHKGYHLALGGGVLNRGFSHNDLDIIALPLDNTNPSNIVTPKRLVELLTPYLGTPAVEEITPFAPSVRQGEMGGNVVFSFLDEDSRKIDLLFYSRSGVTVNCK